MKAFFKFCYLGGMPGFMLMLRPFLYAVLARRRDLSEYGSVDFAAIIFIFHALFSFGVSWKEFHSQHKHFYYELFFKSNLLIFIAYSVLALFSTIWSVNVPLTGYRAFECFSMIFLISAVVVKLTREQGFEVMMEWVVVCYVIWEIAVKAIMLAVHGNFNFHELSLLSQMSATVFFYIAVYHLKNRLVKLLVFLFSIFSGSTTSYVGMSFGLLGAWFAPREKKLIAVFGVIILAFALSIFGTHDVLKHTIFSQKEGIGMEYTNGRNHVWERAWKATLQQPLRGYGFFAGEPFVLYRDLHGAINAHNSICSGLMGMGLPGGILITWYILSYIRFFYGTHLPKQYKLSLASCYVVAFFHCMANPGIGSRVYGSWISVMLLLIMINVLVLDTEEKRRAEEKKVQETWQNKLAVFRR